MRAAWLLPVLLASPALAQEPDQDERALRAETGQLLARVVEKTTRPVAEESELELTVSIEGRPFDRAARVEVTWRAATDDQPEALRVRFREPPALQDQAWLQVWGPTGPTCWRWAPGRPRVERVAALPDGWRLAGSGLTLGQLRGERAAAWRWQLTGEARREGQPPLHVLAAAPARAEDVDFPGAARRLLRVEPERRLPLEVDWLDANGALLARARLGDWRALRGRLRPFALEVREPDRVTRVKATLRRGEAPAPHLDPDAFWR